MIGICFTKRGLRDPTSQLPIQHNVICKPRIADVSGNQNQRWPVARNNIENIELAVSNCDVINASKRLCTQRCSHRADQASGVALSAICQGSAALEGAAQHNRGLTLLSRQSRVARSYCEPVFFPHRWTYDNFNIDCQLANHSPGKYDLLRVLSPEYHKVRVNDVDQLVQCSCCLAQMTWPAFSLESVAHAVNTHTG